MDVFDLYAKLSLDSKDYDRSLQQASSAADQWKTKFVMAAKAVSSAFSTSTSVLVGLVKQSVTAYANYEQQAGGIKTLFGAGEKSLEEYAKSVGKTVEEASAEYDVLMEAQDQVFANAQAAWKNQGLSTNEYMQTVTGFAAALKQSTTDNIEAAQVADMALSDMADNVNKFGTSMESVQYAYMGFSKQNYTMLDNLKLGYGGTRSEMERLLADAEAYSGVHYDISSLSDVYNAIHAIQEKLDVVGTTEKEARKTIQGSANALKSAWENTLIAMSSGQGVDTAIDYLVEAFGTLSKNVIPVVQRAIESAAQMLEQLAPMIAEMLPGMVNEVLPPLLSAVTTLVESIAQILGDPAVYDAIIDAGITLFGSLLDNVPAILTALGSGVVNLVAGLASAIGEQFPVVQQVFDELFGDINLPSLENVSEGFSVLGESVITTFDEIRGALDEAGVFDTLVTTFETVRSTIEEVVTAVLAAFDSIVNSPAMATLGETLGETFSGLASQLGPFLEMVGTYMGVIVGWILNIVDSLSTVWDYVSPFVIGVVALIDDIVAAVIGVASTVIDYWAEIMAVLDDVVTFIAGWLTGNEKMVDESWANIKQAIIKALTEAYNSVCDIVNDLWKGVKDAFEQVKKTIKETFDIDLEEEGKKIIDSLKKGIDDKWQSLLDTIDGYLNDLLTNLPDWFKALFGLDGVTVKLSRANFSQNMTEEEKLSLGYSARPDQSLPVQSATGTAADNIVVMSPKSIEDIGDVVDDATSANTTETVEATKDLMNGTERWLKEGEETNENAISGLNGDMNTGFDTVTTGGSGGTNTGYTAADQVREMYQKWSNNTENGQWVADWDFGTELRDTVNGYLGNSVYFGDMTADDWKRLESMPANPEYTQGMYYTAEQNITPAAASTSLTAGTTTADGNLLSVAEGVSPDAIQSWLDLDAALQQVIDTLNGEGAEGGAGVGTEAEEGGLGAESIMDIAKNPISQDVIDSWKNLADAIQAVSNIINGVSGEGEAGEGTSATGTSTDAGMTSGMAGAEGAAEGSLGSIMQIAQTPVSQEVIDSWNNLATAITGVINAINGAAEGEGAVGEGAATASTGATSGASGASEGSEGEGGGSGLAGAFGSVKTVMEEIITVAQNLAAELGTNLPAAIGTLCSILCITSEDEEGNVSAGGGNTLYNSLGSVKGVLEDIYAASRNIAECWTGQLYSAADLLRQYAGDAYGQVQSLANAAQRAAEQYNAAADAVDRFAEAIQALANIDMPSVTVPSLGGKTPGRASGGPVSAGTTYLVGEVGPELFTPSRSGYIIPNDELGRGNGDSVINITFAGDVIGDEKSISAYVRRAVKAGIRQEVLIG